MSRIGPHVLQAFQAELKKYAGPRLNSVLGNLGASGGVGLGVGGLIGAGRGAVKEYRNAREQGADVGQAVSSGIAGAGQGAVKGGLIGGAVGMGMGGGVSALSPEKGEAMRSALTALPSHAGSFARFGQRQVHGLTGWKPAGGLAEIHHGASTRQKFVDGAVNDALAAINGEQRRTLGDVVMGRSAVDGGMKRVGDAVKMREAAQKAEDMGLTNIPGYAKSLKDNGVMKTVGTAFKDQWTGSSLGMKALSLGLPAYSVATEMARDEDPLHKDRGKVERVARAATAAAGGMLLSPLPQGTQMLMDAPSSMMAGEAGKAVDHFRHPAPPRGSLIRPQPRDLTSDNGQAVPSERVVSERAAGQMGEGSPS